MKIPILESIFRPYRKEILAHREFERKEFERGKSELERASREHHEAYKRLHHEAYKRLGDFLDTHEITISVRKSGYRERDGGCDTSPASTQDAPTS